MAMNRTALLMSFLLVACGREPGPTDVYLARDLRQPIKGGQFDFDHTYAVGMVMQLGMYQGSCSGTLIAPNLVLTARHCVAQSLTSGPVMCNAAPFGDVYSGASIFITPDIQIQQNADWFRGESVHVPSEGIDTCGFDVALVILSQNVPPNLAVPGVPRIDLEAQAGETYQAVGYGAEGFSFGGGRKILQPLTVQCSAGQCGLGGQVAPTEWLGDTGVCQGDSGGPALDAADKVIGVVSRGGEGCTTPIYGDVASWSHFIVEIAMKAAARGGYDPPFWALTGSSDPPPTGAGGAGGEPDAGSVDGGGGDPQGSPCADGCPEGYYCVTTGEGANPFCSAACSDDSDCGEGLVCADFGACFPDTATNAAEGGDSGGCSLAASWPPEVPGKRAPWWIGLAVVAAWRRRWSRGGSNP